MTNLKNQDPKTVAARIPFSKGWGIAIALVLVAAITGSALAYQGGQKRQGNATFTKWVTDATAGTMVGVVGGEVGPGTYAGQILAYNDDGTTTTIHATYQVSGSKQAFTADVNVTQNDAAGTAVISGSVTDGWLKGASVAGEYEVLAVCNIPTLNNAYGTVCFKGTLHLTR